MQWSEFLRGVAVTAESTPPGEAHPKPVAGLHYDSRRIEPGWAFVAIRGEQVDGNDYLPQAIARGASAVISERPPRPGLPALQIQVDNARAALAQVSANWFHRPAERLQLIGITGTNGKTTTAFLIEALLRAAGRSTGLVGTIEYHVGREIIPAPHTTPESYDLQALLADMVAAGAEAAVMEVSSHALAMDRVWGCHFAAAVFTNLTQDHLDFHRTMERYLAAKRRLFEGLGAQPPACAVVNQDDAAAAEMLRGYRGRVLTFGLRSGPGPEPMLRATGIVNTPAGLHFQLSGPEGPDLNVRSPLLGRVNVENLLAAIATGIGLGVPRDQAVAAVSQLPRVRGRFERVWAGQPFTVVVDFAHTPDALANLLALARELTSKRVLVTFGCGGDRDRGKRPQMGAVAQRGADWMLLTSDNPRSEDPERILDEIAQGAPQAEREPDRARAIRRLLQQARPGDIAVIAGKGHEQVQIVGERRLPFDDVAVAHAVLTEMGYTA